MFLEYKSDYIILLFRIFDRFPVSSGWSGEGNGSPLQYSCLENPMDRGAWWGGVHGVTKSQTRLSNFIFTFHFHALQKEMATHSSVLAWRIPGTGEPGGLQSMRSLRVRHDWATSLWLFTFMHWRRKWQPISIVLAWGIPGTREPGGLLSMGSHRVGHDWNDLAAAAAWASWASPMAQLVKNPPAMLETWVQSLSW